MRALTNLLGVMILTTSAFAAPTDPPPVVTGQTTTIVNGPNNPVPVSVQGTASVSGNVNAVQSGTWRVGITGNSPSAALFVTNAPLQPVQFSTDLEFFGDFGFGSPVLHVPAGKRFVMEFISLDISFPAGQGRVLGTILHNDDAQGAQHSYALLGVTQDFGIQGIVYIVNQQVRIYVEHAFDFEGFRTIAAFTGTGHAAVSGYLVDIP